jgi:hypothetical protein
MNNSLPSEALNQARCTNFLQHHARRLGLVLQSHTVSQLLDEAFPSEYLYLARNLSDEERWALSATYDGMLKLLPEILEARSKIGMAPVSDDQQKDLELALSVLHKSTWNQVSRSDGIRDNCRETSTGE